MKSAGRHEHNGSWPKGIVTLTYLNGTFSLEHKDFVFIAVRMKRRMAARRYLELPHGKVRRPVLLAHKDPKLTADRPLHFYWSKGNFLTMDNFHAEGTSLDSLTLLTAG